MQERIELIRVLILVEAAIAVVMVLESLGAIAFGGPLGAPVTVVAVLLAVLTLFLVRGIRRRSRWARRGALWLQYGILTLAAVDVALAAALARRGLELMPTLTRIVLPIMIIVQLRRVDVRTAFNARLSRRQRRRRLIGATS